ncbi:MAG TPA: hypothetical protein VJK08_03030 [Patescibacteria group bacterium]|nr:hypothetical protein [Patescibacteria group bacterium]
MENSKKPQSSGFAAVLLVVIALLVSWLWIVPQYKQNQADAAQVSYEVDAVKGKLESLKTATSTIDSLGSTVDSMFVAIPKDTDSGNIVTTLEAIATANKIYIPSFQITSSSTDSTSSPQAGSTSTTSTTSAEGQDTSSNIVSVSFSASGDFAGLTAFVKGVENNLKFFNVKSLTIASDDKGALAMTLQLEAYMQDITSSLSSSGSTSSPQATPTVQ